MMSEDLMRCAPTSRGGSVAIGYGIVPSARGNGFAAEAVQALAALARRHGLSRIVPHTDEDHIASQRTLERAGFTRTGTKGALCLCLHATCLSS